MADDVGKEMVHYDEIPTGDWKIVERSGPFNGIKWPHIGRVCNDGMYLWRWLLTVHAVFVLMLSAHVAWCFKLLVVWVAYA